MKKLLPQKLKKGDTIGLLSVSGNIEDKNLILKAQKFFEKEGFRTIVSDTSFETFRYMAGSDEKRAKTLNEFFANEEISAIICTRGGYGALRISDKIDYEQIKKHPKIFCGYSDITALLTMIYKKTGLVTFHGAMAVSDFSYEQNDDFTTKSFFDTLCYGCEKITSNEPPVNSGKSEGVFWGGNLSTLVSLFPPDFVPDEDFIFFTEDINEYAYKIDKMFTQLFNCEKFKNNVKGIVTGKFTNTDNYEFVREILKEFGEKYNIPVCGGFKISHEKNKVTVPVGVKCHFDATKGIVEFERSLK